MRSLFGDFAGGRIGAGLLFLRVVLGVGMMAHGLKKIQNPFGWMDKPNAPPAPTPDILQALAALGEFGGGLALALGFVTPLAALGIIATMLGAYFISHRGDPWVNITGKAGVKTFELASLYFTGAMAILLAGPGRFSLDALFFGGPPPVPEHRLADITPPER